MRVSKSQRRALVALMREFIDMMEEIHYMSLILDRTEIMGSSVSDWRDEIDRLRQSSAGQFAIRARIARDQIDKFEREADENDLMSLIEKMSKGHLPN